MACPYCGALPGYCDCIERIICVQAGEVMHSNCGWCAEHQLPKFQCACFFNRKVTFVVPVERRLPAASLYAEVAQTVTEMVDAHVVEISRFMDGIK